MAENFTREVLARSIATTLKANGVESLEASALYSFIDIAEQYILKTAGNTAKLTGSCRRSQSNLFDVLLAAVPSFRRSATLNGEQHKDLLLQISCLEEQTEVLKSIRSIADECVSVDFKVDTFPYSLPRKRTAPVMFADDDSNNSMLAAVSSLEQGLKTRLPRPPMGFIAQTKKVKRSEAIDADGDNAIHYREDGLLKLEATRQETLPQEEKQNAMGLTRGGLVAESLMELQQNQPTGLTVAGQVEVPEEYAFNTGVAIQEEIDEELSRARLQKRRHAEEIVMGNLRDEDEDDEEEANLNQ